MSTTTRIAAGSPFPTMIWPLAGGSELNLAGDKGWRLLVVYRGKHCPLCKKYLATLGRRLVRQLRLHADQDPAQKRAAADGSSSARGARRARHR